MTKQTKTPREISTEIATLQAELSKSHRDAETERLAKPLTVGEFEAKLALLNSKTTADTMLVLDSVSKLGVIVNTDIMSNDRLRQSILKHREQVLYQSNLTISLITLALLLNSAVFLWSVI
ncbi:MAG: hypothetical protein M0R06_01980 [Sphaerochaeta sp.]|jgi:hypothetical protein|nr:hypothetical protein [Sphaerochaeta sp.]